MRTFMSPRSYWFGATLTVLAACGDSPVEPSRTPDLQPSAAPAANGEYVIHHIGAPQLYGRAIAINERGEAVIEGSTDYYSQRGFFWRNDVTTDLGSLGRSSVDVTGLSEAGTVVGTSATTASSDRGFVWRDGVMTDLGTLPSSYGDYTFAAGINASGAVVGTSGSHPFLWRNGVMTDLTPSGGPGGWASAVNDAGQVIGTYARSGEFFTNRPFFWENGRLTEIPVPEGSYGVQLQGLNASGQVIAIAFMWPQLRSFVWHRGKVTDLGDLGGNMTFAWAINDAGEIVGGSDTQETSFSRHAFLWRKGNLIDLGTLGGSSSEARAINQAGEVVGSSQTATGEYRAFVWKNGVMTAVGPPGSAAWAINAKGDILGEVPAPGWRTQFVVWKRR